MKLVVWENNLEHQILYKIPDLLKNGVEVQLQLESIHCSVQDQLQGVVTDCLRHAVGRDYEVLLEQRLKEANIAFLDEESQRQDAVFLVGHMFGTRYQLNNDGF